jgi:hypothetical protein
MHVEACKVIDKSFTIVTSFLSLRCFACVGHSARNRYEICDDNAIYDVPYLYESIFLLLRILEVSSCYTAQLKTG